MNSGSTRRVLVNLFSQLLKMQSPNKSAIIIQWTWLFAVTIPINNSHHTVAPFKYPNDYNVVLTQKDRTKSRSAEYHGLTLFQYIQSIR